MIGQLINDVYKDETNVLNRLFTSDMSELSEMDQKFIRMLSETIRSAATMASMGQVKSELLAQALEVSGETVDTISRSIKLEIVRDRVAKIIDIYLRKIT